MVDASSTGLATLPRPLALVLSGGASLGAVQVGQLAALAELGVAPDLVVGTSVGAINALFVARGFSASRVDALADVWRGLRRQDVFGTMGLGSALRLLKGDRSLATSTALESLIRRLLPRDPLELALAAHVVAVDYLGGHAVVLSAGDLHRNALASAAIPNVFPPVEIEGRLLVDGGLAANVPMVPAAQLGARTLIVLDAGYPCALTTAPRGLVEGILHAMTLALRNQTHGALPALAREHAVIYLPAPCPLSTPPHDFSRTVDLIRTGHDLAHEFLGQVALDGPGIYGHPHFHPEVTT